jgi:hypothetical protein
VSSKNNSRISGTCSVGTKTFMRVLFAVYYSPVEMVLLYTRRKVVRSESLHSEPICSSAYIPPTVHLLADALYHILFNIFKCCTDPCFQFMQRINFLAVHLVCLLAQEEKFQRRNIRMRGPRRWSSSSIH